MKSKREFYKEVHQIYMGFHEIYKGHHVIFKGNHVIYKGIHEIDKGSLRGLRMPFIQRNVYFIDSPLSRKGEGIRTEDLSLYFPEVVS